MEPVKNINELNKTQLILLTLLITFVVSIATGIVTVSLMSKVPKSVPQTINSVIERTIEKVSTVPTPVATTDTNSKSSTGTFGDGDAVVSIYPSDKDAEATTPIQASTVPPMAPQENQPVSPAPKALGQGIIISDVGLVLVDSNILTGKEVYKVTLGKTDFDATILMKFANGFTVLKISK